MFVDMDQDNDKGYSYEQMSRMSAKEQRMKDGKG